MPKVDPIWMPTTDPEWEALSDEELAKLPSSQRGDSEKAARQASRDLRDKIYRLRNNGRSERLAVHLMDLDRMDPTVRQRMVSWRLDPEGVVRLDEDILIPFKCDLLEAAKVCDIMRSHDREVGDYETRVYLTRDGKAWTKLRPADILCSTATGECQLNPDLFTSARVQIVPLPFDD